MPQQTTMELPRAAVERKRDGLRQMLRDGTQAQHRALDQQPSLRELLEPGVTVDKYAAVLAMLLGWYRAFEPALTAALGTYAPDDIQERLKTPLLLCDLTFLGITPVSAHECPTLPSLETPEAALGAAYVVEGATLGGTIICRHLREHLPQSTPLHFYSAYGDARGAMWQKFLVHLETKVHRDEMRARAVVAAQDTFASLDRWVACRSTQICANANDSNPARNRAAASP